MSESHALEAARHLCQEARVVLTSLRGGPPNVARGDLAQDLMDMRAIVKQKLALDASQEGSASSLVPMSPPRQKWPNSPPEDEDEDGAVLVQSPDQLNSSQLRTIEDVGSCARPFLAIVMDPRAAGPHTLVALRALHRLLERSSLVPASGEKRHGFVVGLEPLTKGVLNCKFEQTDAGADEAVEMAIADLLALLVRIDRRSIRHESLMDAFHTVFVTRNTFIHSPALCYHFEDVLKTMIRKTFGDLETLQDPAAKLILEFLVNQLLHTPFVGGDDEASREAQMAHDATRVLCLRLIRTALRSGFQNIDDEMIRDAATKRNDKERSLLDIVKDDLCLSLLMTGQAIWADEDNSSINPGFISLEVLSEICSTISTLWVSVNLRKHLVSQFESIFTGFFQRALVLLRKRMNPTDSITFHANLVFDAGTEIILEGLIDILSLHDHNQTIAQGNGGCLETLFATYDCNMKKSDAAVGLMIELCRCCGSKVDEEGNIILDAFDTEQTPNDSTTDTVPRAEPNNQGGVTGMENYDDSPPDVLRQVPPHLKELCAEAIIGSMKCLFRDDHPREKTKIERRDRQTILEEKLVPAPASLSDVSRTQSVHLLRSIKSKKRLMRQAAHLFNSKSSKGIEFLVRMGVIADPVTPRSVASFLRNGIVVGLDKRAVGEYLGAVGKAPVAGKSPPSWERDWFHKEVLETYCSLFRFEGQSLLDGLRMFLACFRLPGEAQQIDRILQAFSDSCSKLCEEGSQGLFSDDPKRASDAAYLLSFSIIMLNTDRHNDNIREDRKMSKQDFVKNNTDYGRDITEPGKEFPEEYLGAIYDSIRDEEIRTEGEGADGSMTVERWKDVLRGSAEESEIEELPTITDAEDLTELVLEHVWMPIMSAISALWGVRDDTPNATLDTGSGGMLGAQGARLGMDMAWDMLTGLRSLGRNDIFCKIFNRICMYTGLLDYSSNAAERAWAFANSVEAQGAFILALRATRETNDDMGVDGLKRIWSMIFELRDLKMLGGGKSSRRRSILIESDPDLLKEYARTDLNVRLVKRGQKSTESTPKRTGLFGTFSAALFGSIEEPSFHEDDDDTRPNYEVKRTAHGKEDHIIWDDLAPSDDEDEGDLQRDDSITSLVAPDAILTIGAEFSSQLIQEDMLINQQRQMPVTGLERVDDAQANGLSPRARVRKRLFNCCDFAALVADSRFMDDKGIRTLIEALLALIPEPNTWPEESSEEGKTSSQQYPISPASEAFAEILICEIALRNRDRLTMLWETLLRDHYRTRLQSITQTYTESEDEHVFLMNGAIEKVVTGLIRISSFAVQKGQIPNDVLDTWTILDSIQEGEKKVCLVDCLDLHLCEGLVRITRCVDDATKLSPTGWKGLLSLTHWCSTRGCKLPPVSSGGIGGLEEDDPALQTYRSLHFLINVSEVKDSVPTTVTRSICDLIVAGSLRNCPKLSVAGLDLLQELSSQKETKLLATAENDDTFWKNIWRPGLEGMIQANQSSRSSSVRQHALSMLTDSFLRKQGGFIPISHLCDALGKLCIPLAGRGIIELREGRVEVDSFDELMIELELCIGLIFKPLRHHLKYVVSEGDEALTLLWKPILELLTEILKDPTKSALNAEEGPNQALESTNELIIEHLRSAIVVLIGFGVLKAEPETAGDFTAYTWEAVSSMDACKSLLPEWKKAANHS